MNIAFCNLSYSARSLKFNLGILDNLAVHCQLGVMPLNYMYKFFNVIHQLDSIVSNLGVSIWSLHPFLDIGSQILDLKTWDCHLWVASNKSLTACLTCKCVSLSLQYAHSSDFQEMQQNLVLNKSVEWILYNTESCMCHKIMLILFSVCVLLTELQLGTYK